MKGQREAQISIQGLQHGSRKGWMLRSECDIRWIEYGMSGMKKLTTERTGGGVKKGADVKEDTTYSFARVACGRGSRAGC